MMDFDPIRRFLAVTSVGLLLSTSTSAQDSSTKPSLSEAEQVIRLHRAVDTNEERLKELSAELEDPKSEYQKALEEFKTLDGERAKHVADSKELRESGDAFGAAKAEAALKEVLPKWEASKRRFELAFQDRRTHQEEIAALKDRISQDRETLTRLTAPPTHEATPKAETPSQPMTGGEKPTPMVPLPIPGLPTTGNPNKESPKKETEELTGARKTAEEKEQAALEAEKRAQSIEERIGTARRALEAARQRIENAAEQEKLAREAKANLEAELRTKQAANAPEAELTKLRTQIREQATREREATEAIRKARDASAKSQLELSTLQGEQISALQDAERARREAEDAQDEVSDLENPFTLRNMFRWLIDHGPKILFIIIVMLVLGRLVAISSRSVARWIVKQRSYLNHLKDRAEKERAATLASVYRHATTGLIYVVGILMILEEMGLPVTTLLGGAAVLGLALSFGAQSLIKDYFTGFMILAEDQYTVGDVVKIGDNAGTVEDVTLRMTRLRDIEGQAHFIPNGEIRNVVNMSHGWSRAFLEIGVAYKENVDHVMEVLLNVAKEMREDKKFGVLILEEPEMLGVERFDDSAVVVRFFVKTVPLQQWGVRREMLRRIKNRFDELGISIPFPHRTLFLHHETEESATKK